MKRWQMEMAVTVALLVSAIFPAGVMAENRAGAFTVTPMVGGHVFEGDQHLDDDFTYGLALGYNLSPEWSIEGLANYTGSEDEKDRFGNVDVFVFRLEALYHFLPKSSLVPYIAVGAGGITYNGDGGANEDDFLADYGLGLKWFFQKDLALRADVRHLYAFDDPDNNLLYTAGLSWQIGGAAPPVPEPVRERPVAAAAPPDSDRDGVVDERDRCPGTPQGVQVDERGCPRDSDGDGVPDYLDKCPDTPQGVQVDERGCPRDSDGDGVPDYLDKCPDTPQGVQVDERGCPRDSDGDGVPDHLDKCPDTRKGEYVDEQGCTIKLTLHINFDFDKAVIKPEFKPDLDRAATFIKKYEKVPKILIEGHTDSIGTEDYNKDLSMRRAEAVRQYLIDNFSIDPNRLVPRGVGESQPVASNETDEGRYQNRRVEIICCVVIPPEQ